MPTTEDECIQALREATEKLGESPSKAAYEALGCRPASATIIRVLGSWNGAKAKANLETNPSSGSRMAAKPDHVELSNGVTWESLSQDQRWHYQNKDRNARRTLERRQRLRHWLAELKVASGGCLNCDETEPLCLDFHHRDENQKTMAVNKMVLYGFSKSKIRAEIEKCDVLCSNCHWRKHHTPVATFDSLDSPTRRDGPPNPEGVRKFGPAELTKEQRLRAWAAAYKRSFGCRQCGETDPSCLQFHHGDSDKSAGVGAMINDSNPIEEVLEEMAKCTVLCSNCHRQIHVQNPKPASGGSDSV